MSSAVYQFSELPVEPIEAGQTLLLLGPSRLASEVARTLVFHGGHGDGVVYVSTGTSGTTVAEECRTAYPDLDLSTVGIVDAAGRGDTATDTGARIEAVSSTSDLTGISIKNSILWEALQRRGIDRVRTCFDSLSLLLLFTNFRTIMRFVHTIDGRVSATKGLGVFVLDPTMHDPQVEYTLKHVCDGAIELRNETGDTHELRVEGFAGQPRGWHPFER